MVYFIRFIYKYNKWLFFIRFTAQITLILKKTEMKMKIFIVILTLSSGYTFSKDRAILTDWEMYKSADGIAISYRWVKIGDTLKTRELKTVFKVNAKTDVLLKQFTNDNKLSSWTAGSRECYVLQESENEWITHTLYDIPWPFSNNDLITRYHKEQDEAIVSLKIESIPDFIPELEDVERIKHYEGSWVFTANEDGSTHVEFRSTSFTKPLFPRFIQDPILQDMMINSMIKFKTQAETEP